MHMRHFLLAFSTTLASDVAYLASLLNPTFNNLSTSTLVACFLSSPIFLFFYEILLTPLKIDKQYYVILGLTLGRLVVVHENKSPLAIRAWKESLPRIVLSSAMIMVNKSKIGKLYQPCTNPAN